MRTAQFILEGAGSATTAERGSTSEHGPSPARSGAEPRGASKISHAFAARLALRAGTARGPVRGSLIVGLLWCVALLSLVVVGVLHTSRMDLIVVKNYGDKLQAHY